MIEKFKLNYLYHREDLYLENLYTTYKGKKHKIAICICNDSNSNLDESEKNLCNEERMFYNSIKHEGRKISYLLGRFAAKKAISSYANESLLGMISVRKGIYNQPIVEYSRDNKIQVTITHSKNIGAAIAFDESFMLGIDIENVINSGLDNSLDEFISGEEKVLFGSTTCNKREFYTMLWSSKEALSKLLKLGFISNIRIFEIANINKCKDINICNYKYFSQFISLSFFIENYILSIACPKGTDISINIPQVRKVLNSS